MARFDQRAFFLYFWVRALKINDMTTAVIRKKLADYLQVADEQKVRAIYTMVKDDIDTEANDWTPAFIKELERRSRSLAEGSAKTYTWEETKKAAMSKAKSKRK
jgi:hypothetical protein